MIWGKKETYINHLLPTPLKTINWIDLNFMKCGVKGDKGNLIHLWNEFTYGRLSKNEFEVKGRLTCVKW